MNRIERCPYCKDGRSKGLLCPVCEGKGRVTFDDDNGRGVLEVIRNYRSHRMPENADYGDWCEVCGRTSDDPALTDEPCPGPPKVEASNGE